MAFRLKSFYLIPSISLQADLRNDKEVVVTALATDPDENRVRPMHFAEASSGIAKC